MNGDKQRQPAGSHCAECGCELTLVTGKVQMIEIDDPQSPEQMLADIQESLADPGGRFLCQACHQMLLEREGIAPGPDYPQA